MRFKRSAYLSAPFVGYQLSYQEYVWLPVYDNYGWREQLSKKVMVMNDDEMLGASRRVKIRPEKAIVMEP
ncbi:MAG: hypothetical protein LW832_07345, partial [Parachlamydia sp.]|nr:hypothetical protein [Parachlamydia sp.]